MEDHQSRRQMRRHAARRIASGLTAAYAAATLAVTKVEIQQCADIAGYLLSSTADHDAQVAQLQQISVAYDRTTDDHNVLVGVLVGIMARIVARQPDLRRALSMTAAGLDALYPHAAAAAAAIGVENANH